MLAKSPSLERAISPPPPRRQQQQQQRNVLDGNNPTECHSPDADSQQTDSRPSLAAIEAGKAVIDDHLAYFSTRFQAVARETCVSAPLLPRLSIAEFEGLYQRNLTAHGRHFVVHQHDHPISGVHYDLRLQFSQTSTISFAIPYGLPGNLTSIRPYRMAIETRVHNLWNNLIESASRATGSLLIWDIGEYDVLPYREDKAAIGTDDELSDHEASEQLSASELLYAAFQSKHIRLRLNGRRLPAGYTISLRLPRNNYQGRVKDPARKRPKLRTTKSVFSLSAGLTDSGDEGMEQQPEENEAANASDDDEDAIIRATNAYTGATNTIGSIHQRHWFLSLDKKNSNLPEPFFVMGRDVERSIVTGRTADQVLSDEGVTRFIGRKMWRPITE